jgi:hypothetical protein
MRSARRDGDMASLADVEDGGAGSRRALHKSIRGSCTDLEACWTVGGPQVIRNGGRIDWDPGCEGKEPRSHSGRKSVMGGKLRRACGEG